MRVLVIGGTRFIGAEVVRQFVAGGHEVAVFHTGRTPGTLPDGVTHLHGDARQLDESRAALRGFAPEVVLHNIVLGERDVQQAHDVFAGVARRLVMTSSMDVYRAYGWLNGTEPGEPPAAAPSTDEDAPLRTTLYPYRERFADPAHPMHGYDKIPAERLALAAGAPLPGTVLRLPMVLGPHDWQRRLLPLVVPMRDARPRLLWSSEYAEWVSTFGYVENVAAAMVRAASDERAAGRVYNVADCALTMRELAGHVRAATGWRGEIVTAPGARLPAALRFDVARPVPLVCSAARIARELDYVAPVDFGEGVRRTVTWDLANVPDPLPATVADYALQDDALAQLTA